MTKDELFKKYSINESHSEWNDSIDNWTSVELFRLMHNGKLPADNNVSVMWLIDFCNKVRDDMKFRNEIMKRDDFGSLYLTSKRMIYAFADQILEALKKL